jgi:hypothetical protein
VEYDKTFQKRKREGKEEEEEEEEEGKKRSYYIQGKNLVDDKYMIKGLRMVTGPAHMRITKSILRLFLINNYKIKK